MERCGQTMRGRDRFVEESIACAATVAVKASFGVLDICIVYCQVIVALNVLISFSTRAMACRKEIARTHTWPQVPAAILLYAQILIDP